MSAVGSAPLKAPPRCPGGVNRRYKIAASVFLNLFCHSLFLAFRIERRLELAGAPGKACHMSQPCATLQHSNPTMARANKLLDQILRGGADANIPFSGMVQLLKRLGFQERIKGSHHIFFRDGVAEILNLQPYSGKCKPYQVKQVRNVIINYRLAGEADA